MIRILWLACVICVTASAQEGSWTPLFDGKTLSGWEVCNGKASYKVEGGTITGTTAEGSPNSFLCTTREYGDFVLEFETRTDPALNSGVQIRSHRYSPGQMIHSLDGKQLTARKTPAGRVYGYQVEIANEESGASGGIYDEARRGWLANISSDPAASKAFKDNQWNRYRVVAEGDNIRVWVNDVPCANLTDSLDQSGFIALQVHAYKGEKPAQVRWRNLRIQDRGRHVWKPLWDGQTLDGWAHRGGGSFTVENGAIHAQSVDGDTRIGFIVSAQSFGDITARLKFKMTKGNSGFFLRAAQDTLAGYEVEIDDAKGTGGFWETGANGRKWVTGPEDNAAVMPGDWNDLAASLHGHKIVFHVNGVKTMELLNDTPGRLDGHLALQAHGSRRPTEIWFKDIEILVPAR